MHRFTIIASQEACRAATSAKSAVIADNSMAGCKPRRRQRTGIVDIWTIHRVSVRRLFIYNSWPLCPHSVRYRPLSYIRQPKNVNKTNLS